MQLHTSAQAMKLQTTHMSPFPKKKKKQEERAVFSETVVSYVFFEHFAENKPFFHSFVFAFILSEKDGCPRQSCECAKSSSCHDRFEGPLAASPHVSLTALISLQTNHFFICLHGMQAATGVSALSMATAAEAPKAAPVEKFRKDYKHVHHVIKTVDLTFKIFDDNTQV
jgi:hypothetical protein